MTLSRPPPLLTIYFHVTIYVTYHRDQTVRKKEGEIVPPPSPSPKFKNIYRAFDTQTSNFVWISALIILTAGACSHGRREVTRGYSYSSRTSKCPKAYAWIALPLTLNKTPPCTCLTIHCNSAALNVRWSTFIKVYCIRWICSWRCISPYKHSCVLRNDKYWIWGTNILYLSVHCRGINAKRPIVVRRFV